MIKDKFQNINNFNNLSDDLKNGLQLLVSTDFNNISDGRHEISEDIYMNVQTYFTKETADYEAHKEYIDIQYIIKGKEKIGVCPYSQCQIKIPYSKEKDIEFLDGYGEFYDMKEGDFMILFPEDAHKPSITLESRSEVRKAVVKIRIK